MSDKEMIAADYYIHEPNAEREALERWENEGGRFRQHHDYILDSFGKGYLRHMEQSIPTWRIAGPNEFVHAARLSSKARASV